MQPGEIFAGIAACIGLNVMLVFLGGLTDVGAIGLLGLVANLGCIIGPALAGRKGFAVGFALGYVVAVVLFLGACFLLIAGFAGRV